MLYDWATNDWTTRRLLCRNAVRAADGSLAFLMTFAPDEPAGTADVALPHGFSLRDLAYLRALDVCLPLGGLERDCGMFGVAQ